MRKYKHQHSVDLARTYEQFVYMPLCASGNSTIGAKYKSNFNVFIIYNKIS